MSMTQSAVPLLARVWQEEDVWNMSAFDLPIVVCGDTLEAARQHFEEAVQAHFEALTQLQKVEQTLRTLSDLAATREFYAQRMEPHTLVESFAVGPHTLAA